MNKKLRQLINDLCNVVKSKNDKVSKILNDVRNEYKKEYNIELSAQELFRICKGKISYNEIRYYWNIKFMLPEWEKYGKGYYLTFAYQTTALRRKELQEKLLKVFRDGEFNKEMFRMNPANYLKELLPEISNIKQHTILLFNTLYRLRQLEKDILKGVDKLEPFEQDKLLREWKLRKKEIDRKLLKIKTKNYYIVRTKDKNQFDAVKKYFGIENQIPNLYAFKVTSDKLFDNFEILKQHRKILIS